MVQADQGFCLKPLLNIWHRINRLSAKLAVQVTAKAEAFFYLLVKFGICHIYGLQWKPWLHLTAVVRQKIYSLHYFLKLACDGQTVAMDMLHAPDKLLVESSDPPILVLSHEVFNKN